MRTPSFLLLALISSSAMAGGSSECRNGSEALATLSNPDKEYDLRSRVGTCLVRTRLDQADVNRAVLRILRDPSEDILLKEDLIEAFADSPLRHKVKLEGKLAPEMGQQEKDAVDRALSGAGSLLAAAQAVRTMEETVPVSRFEPDFFKVLSDIALDESSHVLLRAASVGALEKLSERVFNSGVYDDKSVRLVRDTLKSVAARDDLSSFYTNAGNSYNRLAVAGLPGFTREVSVNSGRMISSVKGLEK